MRGYEVEFKDGTGAWTEWLTETVHSEAYFRYRDLDTNKDIEAGVGSIEELEKLLIHIQENAKDSYPAFDMVHTNGNTLVLAVSPDGCYAYYMDATEEVSYRNSLGDRTLSGEDGEVEFMYGGHLSLIPKRYIISLEALLRVAKAFFVTGTWPETVIDWE